MKPIMAHQRAEFLIGFKISIITEAAIHSSLTKLTFASVRLKFEVCPKDSIGEVRGSWNRLSLS